jgi:DNA-binding transcriptional ArsR family regulator
MDRFVALADPTRRRIIETLCSGERSFGEIAAAFEISRPAVSQHLKVLKDTGLVSVRADAQRRIYELNAGGIDDIDAWLSKVRSYWTSRLDRLEHELREKKNNE